MPYRSRIRTAIVAMLVVLAGACATKTPQATEKPTQAPTVQPTASVAKVVGDPIDIIHATRIEEAKMVEESSEPLPRDAFSDAPFEEKAGEEPVPERPPEKIHPALLKLLAEQPAGDRAVVIVSFTDEVSIPRFPDVSADVARDTGAYKEALAESERLVADITAQREPAYARITQDLFAQYDAKVTDTFWLVNAVRADLPLGSVQALAEREDVRYVEPDDSGEEPPQDSNTNNDVVDGRARISSDPYFNLGQTGGWIGLLDTGLRFSHTSFSNPSHIDFRRDCVNGGADCNSGPSLNPNDDCWNHGTSTAAIITGNGNLGDAYRGVTGITLDSFKVYPSTNNEAGKCTGFLNETAVLRGFQVAVAVLDRVIVAEMQGGGNDTSAISTAADNAFDAGAVIIAANGNFGPGSSTVNAPANAHKVIGVGNFDVDTGGQIASQSRGPALDQRFKPDIQAPTNSETASNASDSALRMFSGTSGSTPYAAAAAALLRNWLRGDSFSIDPGQVYAQLILSGQTPYPFDNTSGAGRLQLPTDGLAWWGKLSVADGATIDIPIGISGKSANTLDGALWWPETAAQAHNDVDLYLIQPGGSSAAASLSIPSVFERARVSGSISEGTWKVRVRGYRVPAGPQTVYWAARVGSR